MATEWSITKVMYFSIYMFRYNIFRILNDYNPYSCDAITRKY